MAQYQVFDPKSEVMGQMVFSMTKSILLDDIKEILERHGMDNIDPANWYPVQSLMEIFNEFATDTSQIFISIGMASAQTSLETMPQLKNMPFHAFFANFDSVWQSRHRNGDVGHLEYKRINDNHITLTFRSPYPDDIFYGAFYAYTRALAPKDMDFKVTFDENMPRREHGGEVTILHIHLE